MPLGRRHVRILGAAAAPATGTSVPGGDPRIIGPHAHGYEATASWRLVYSVNTLHMGGDEPPPVAQRIIPAALS